MPRPRGRSPIARCVSASIPRVMKRSSSRRSRSRMPERGVARAGDLARRLEHLVEHGLGVELRQQAAADVDQAAQPLLVEMVVHVGADTAPLGIRSHSATCPPAAGRMDAMAELRAGELTATWLPEHGMVGASLRHRGGELLGQRGGLDAYVAKGSAFGIPLLAPWANRLDGLRYGDVVLDPARVKGGAEGLPKDGALAGRPWTVEAASETSLRARYDAGCDGWEDVLAVFPFPHAWRVVVTLTPAAMTVRTELSATGEVPVPVSFGWHPLFTLPGVARDELEVRLPVLAEAVLDARGIPSGEPDRRPPSWTGGPLGERVLDDEYPELDADGAFVLRGAGRELRVAFDAPGYPVGHAWAPEGEAFVAWEPMTAPTNALVSGRGLRHVAPGDTFAASFEIAVGAAPAR